MIIPKKDAKEYGAVHIDNYLSFIGFCKKVDNDEPCDVKVYLDGKLIDTITANKHIPKVEKIYDIANHSFIFELDEKHFDKSHLLEFKTNNDELLVNGSINTIDKQNPKFNEYRFLHSLSNIDEEKIKDLYCKDAIGFLAVEENLNDKDFMQYLKELYVRFPQVTIKAFYFNDHQRILAQEVFKDQSDRFEFILPKDVYELANEIEIYIFNNKFPNNFRQLFLILKYYAQSIGSIQFTIEHKNYTLKTFLNPNHPLFLDPEYFGYSNSLDKTNIYDILYSPLLQRYLNLELNLNKNLYLFNYFDNIQYLLDSKEIKNHLHIYNKKIMDYLKIIIK